MEINYNQLFENARNRKNALTQEIENFRTYSPENDNIYEMMRYVCGSLSEEEINQLFEEERYIYDLMMRRDDIYDEMSELHDKILTDENKKRIDLIVAIIDDNDREDEFNTLSRVEKHYFREQIEMEYRMNQKARMDLKENWVADDNDEEYDDEDEPEEDD